MSFVFDDEQKSSPGGFVFDDERAASKKKTPAPKERSWAQVAGDTGIDLAKGVLGLGESAVGLADLVSGNLAGKGLGLVGYDPAQTKEFLSTGYSDFRAQANREVADAKGFWNTAGTLVQNPSAIAGAVAESAPMLLGGIGAARSLATKMLAARGLTVGSAEAGAFLSNPAVRAKLALASSVSEGALVAGTIQEQGRQAGRDYTDTAPAALAAGALTTAIGFGTSKIPGFRDVEASVATAGMGGAQRLGLLATGKQIAKDTFKEGVLEEMPQSAQEQVFTNLALGKPWDQGVPEAAAQGMVVGAAQGGGMSVYSAGRNAMADSDLPVVSANTPPAPVIAAQAAINPATKALDTTAAEKALLSPVALTSLDRVNELDTALAPVRQRLAALTPENGYGPMFDQERLELAAQAQALDQERAGLSKDWPKSVAGLPSSFSTEAGVRVQAGYALMDAADLITSHDEGLRKNPLYPAELQPRERDRAASEMQVSSIVQKLDPARLGVSADAANGAPIVGADGLVESGNARTIALKRVYQAGGQKAEDYKQFLRDNAAQFGLTPESVNGMARPVLVRVRSTPVNRAEFARQANASTVAQMAPSEQAKSDANRIDSMMDLSPDDNGDFSNPASRPFVQRFMARLPVTEQAGMMDADGKLSSTGYARVRNAVLAKAYGDSPVLARMTESMDDNLRNVSRAFMLAAPKVAVMRAAIQAGARFDADITPDLMAASEELARIKTEGGSVQDALAQTDLMGEQRTPEARQLLTFLNDNMRRPRRMADFIGAYMDALDAAGDPKQGSLMGDTPAPSKQDLLTAARKATDDTPNPGTTAEGAAAQAGGATGQKPGDAQGRGSRAEGDGADAGGAGPGAQGSQGQSSQPVSTDWVEFAPDAGALGIPRAKMPQVKVNKRPELYDFLKTKGITHTRTFMKPGALKPTQAEYSPSKAEKAQVLDGPKAVVLASSDGYILDGHHRWVSRAALGEMVDVIKFNAPMGQLLAAVREFPGATTSSESAAPSVAANDARAQAVGEFKSALADLAQIASKHTRLAMISEDTPNLMPTLVKLSSAAFKIFGNDLKKVTRWVQTQLKSMPEFKTFWNKIGNDLYQKAALQAMQSLEAPTQDGLFDSDAQANEAVQKGLFDAPAAVAEKPKAAMIGGRLYDYKRDMFQAPDTASFIPAELLERARDQVKKFSKIATPIVLTTEERTKAEGLLRPMLEKANAAKVSYDQKIIDIAQSTGALGQVIPDELKAIARASVKLVDEEFNIENMRDLLRSTIVVRSYADAQAVVDAIYRAFEVMPGRVKNRTDVAIKAKDLHADTGFEASGYGDVLVNVMHEGVQAEIQINVPEMLAAKGAEGHKLYDIEREQPKGSEIRRAVELAQAEFYATASAAALARQDASEMLRGSDKGGQMRAGDNSPRTSENAPRPGMTTASDPLSRSKNSQPSGNLFGTLISPLSDPIIDDGAKKGYISVDKEGANNANRDDRAGAPESQGTGAAPGLEKKRGAERVRDGAGGADQVGGGDSQPANSAEARLQQNAGDRPNEGGRDNEPGDGPGARDSLRRPAGVPAGRDIPAKTGQNYAFGDADLTYEGSWQKKATQNIEAVELLKKLQADKRQANPDEQKILAKFIGFGAGELANNLFGPKLDKPEKLLKLYQKAIANMAELGRDTLRASKRNPYGRGFTQTADDAYYDALKVVRSVHPGHPPDRDITRADLDQAKPDTATARWVALRDRLKALLTPEELAESSRSTQYAHFTSKSIVKSMWQAMARMGFKGGAILEPGAGIGVFPGLMPQAMAINSTYTGIEFDSITGGILKQLFPDERILVESFMDTKLPKNFYDVSIGNPPFSSTQTLSDPEYKKYAFSLHDYFFAKAIDRTKPGGLVVFVTSRYTMDKLNDDARAYLAERADLVGAIRLPQTAFKQNAGTDVVTDVIFLRKKVKGETFEQAKAWGKSAPMQVGAKEFPVNEYFQAHPDMVLGTPSDTGKMQNSPEPQYTVLALPGDIEAQFAKAVQNLPANIYQAARGSSAEAAQVREIDFNPKAQKEGNYYVTDAGVLMLREAGVGMRADKVPVRDRAMVADFVLLRDALKQAHYDQLNNGDWQASLGKLQAAYKAFVAKHGQVNQFTTKTVKVKGVDEESGESFIDEQEVRRFTLDGILNDDPDWTLVQALEKFNDDTGAITPSDFLTDRVLEKQAARNIATPHDALLTTLNDIGKVDMDLIAERIGLTPVQTIEALGTAVYDDPESGWTTDDDYLSGNVKAKLAVARAAAQSDKRYARNVDALLAAQPEALSPSQIDPNIGMNWIPGAVYAQFITDVTNGAVRASVSWNTTTKNWFVEAIAGQKTDAATLQWGTSRRNVVDLLENALTGRPIRIETKQDGADKAAFDAVATEAANQKLAELKDAFAKWVFTNEKRTDNLVRIYNDTFNTTVARKFDGRHLTLPGTSKTQDIFDHVKRGAWRVIQKGNTYLAHAVGSGKTFQMVISAMEQKRLGLIKKPMMVVPGHVLKQFAADWQQLYPAARLMVADENNFHKDNRRRFVSRVALSDLDGVIITHSAFKLLDLDPKFKAKMMRQELAQFRAALEQAGGDADKPGKSKDPKIKRIEKQIENREQKLAAANSSEGKDKNVRFDELGVDFLYVDEAHEFRKLDYSTVRQVKGIDATGSDKAHDLFMKSRWLEEKNPGRSLVLASGTPITNTVAELFTVQRFLGNQDLVERGVDDFDSWAAMFGREVTTLEAGASGVYTPVTRFNDFANVPELTQMFREFADVLNSDQLGELLGDKRPQVQGGSRSMVITPMPDDYKKWRDEDLRPRVIASKKWKPSFAEPNNPDPIIKILGDARLAAADMRFMEPSLPSNPDSKLNRMIDDVVAKYKETAGMVFNDKNNAPESIKGAAMMVFADIGFGAGVAANRGFNAKAWFEKRMRDAGIALNQFAFMGDYKKSTAKQKLFRDVNAGRIRILVGSSKNMGTGVNAQQRLKHLFHLDSPWYPADLEQREGRAVRTGNKNKVVNLNAYATKGTYEQDMWAGLARKQMFIDKALSGDKSVRRIEDLDGANLMAMASGLIADDPRVLQLAGLNADIGKYQRLYQAHEADRARFKQKYDLANETLSFNTTRLPIAEQDASKAQDLSGDKFTAKVLGQKFTERAKWGEALVAEFKKRADRADSQKLVVGEISGFPITYIAETVANIFRPALRIGTPSHAELVTDSATSPAGVAMRAQNDIAELARLPDKIKERIAQAKAEINALETKLEAKFAFAQTLADAVSERDALEAELAAPVDATATNADNADITESTSWDFLEDADYAAGAAMGMMGAPMLSRGTGGGMAVAVLEKLATRIQKRMPNMPKVNVLASPLEAPPALRAYIEKQGAMQDADGAMHEGELYLFASGLPNALRAEHVLAEHEAAHFGLRAILGDALPGVMQAIYNNNASVRQAAAELQRRGKLSDVEATEEVIVDIPSAQLVKLKGWRQVVQKARDWLADHGFEAMAAKLSGWLDGKLTDQQRADLMVAKLVRSARAYMRGKQGGDTRLSGTLADDVARQERWLSTEARSRGYSDIDQLAEKNYPLFEKLAELWRKKNPATDGVLLSRAYMPLVSARSELESQITSAIAGFNRAMKESSGEWLDVGRTPHVLSMVDQSTTPKKLAMPGAMARKVFFDKHGGEFAGMTADMLVRALYRPAMVFSDTAEAGNVSLVTNILTATGPVVVNVQVNGKAGGVDVAVVKSIYTKKNAMIAKWVRGEDKTRGLLYADKYQAPEAITGRLNPENKNPTFEGRDLLAKETINASGSNNRGTSFSISNTSIVTKYGTPVNENYSGWNTVAPRLQAMWDGAKINGKPQPRLKDYGSLLAWIDKHYKGDAADKPMLSRAPVQGTPAERADKLIQTNAATAQPVDALARGLTRITGVERLTRAIYKRAGYLLDRYTPETVKAGMVSDYGVPEAVIDQRAMMQGRQRVQLRKAGSLIEKLATLTRAESRVAYEWMNETDPQAIYSMMQGLPEESVKVLQEVQAMIDQLSREAVRMGQLSPEAYERNKFAYLRRSYEKHTLNQSATEKAGRARVISILGDQYKGRGLTESASMVQMQNSAPDWWARKLTQGKADTALKGEKFVRLERRAASGQGTTPLPGMTGKDSGKLKEVHYFPVGVTLPAKYADWTQAGTFEVRDTKGDKAILWRDFTKDERENMGEIDEARFAIAKTLHAMIHDVEVGRYLEWLASTYAKKEGETIPGVVVEASERYADVFKPGEWVRVPDNKIAGTSVLKYGKLAGRYLPGPIWNDLRQTVNGQFQPFGPAYAEIQSLWKISKTALSPSVHLNNIMSNVVMADWHDVTAGHTAKALRILLGAHALDGQGLLGNIGNLAAKAGGMNDRDAAREVINRYLDSGGNLGSWATNEVANKQIEPLLAAMEAELAASGGNSVQAQIGVMAALQHALYLQLPSAFVALKGSKPGKLVGTELATMMEMYQNEDEVFRLAAWLKAKEDGKTDAQAGKAAKSAFLDYNINAPWVQALRNSALPFVSYSYRAIPKALEVVGNKPHKLLKLMLVLGAINALGSLLAGGDDDEERKLLPEEKAGRIWGLVPKLIRMPWNDANASPVYLDIRRFIPVGDVLDTGATNSAIPILPVMMIGGPLAIIEEFYANKSNFTGKPITLGTDTAFEKTSKVLDHLYKAFMPNIVVLPGTYAYTGVLNAAKGKTDAFGREQSVAQAMASSFGVKLGSYPADVLRKNEVGKAQAQLMEIDKGINQLKRQRQTNSIDQEEFEKKVLAQVEKKRKVMQDLQEKLR